jgi:hypothetical protein
MKGLYPGLWLCLTGIINSSANAQVPSTDDIHWLRDQHGCLLNNPNPHPKAEESVRWTGACKDGYGDGPGKLEWIDKSGVSDGWRKGNFVRGNLEGVGEALTVRGSHVNGEFRDGLENGHGILVFVDGTRYDGEFLNGRADGHGTITWPNGARFDGEFRDSKGVGRGTLIDASGARYDGDFKDSRIDGHGTITWPDGTKTEVESKGGLCNNTTTPKAQIFCSTAPTFP